MQQAHFHGQTSIAGKCTKGVDGGMDEDAGQQAAATIKNRDQQETHGNCKDDLAQVIDQLHGTSYSFKMDRKHFALLQFHLAAVCSGHTFNIQAVRIRVGCAVVRKAFGAASHQHQPGSQNHKQEKRCCTKKFFDLVHCNQCQSLPSNSCNKKTQRTPILWAALRLSVWRLER